MRQEIFNRKKIVKIPDKTKTSHWVDAIYNWLFADSENTTFYDFEKKETELHDDLIKILETTVSKAKAEHVAKDFFQSVDGIYNQLLEDIENIINYDPAAKSVNEVIAAYPGFYAVAVYRMSHQLWKSDVPVIPRLFSEYVHSKAGIDIHPGAQIGERFLIDHGTGVVIGETSVIGDDVKIYQGVTLGALSVIKDLAEKKRHPTIKNNVVIYANATILGGKTVIGSDSVIGGNVWLTSSIPPNSLVYHKSESIIKDKNPFPQPINFVI